jgi:hypothetical protein
MTEPLHDTDVQAWLQQQAAALRAGQWAAVDVAHVAEVIEALGREPETIVRRDLGQLVFDALTWSYDPRWRHPSWALRQQVAQLAIARHLHMHTRLRAWLPVLLHGAYPEARQLAAQQTTLALSTFPDSYPWDVDDLLTQGWRPAEAEEQTT